MNNVKNIEERLKKSKKNIIIKGIVKKYCEGKLKRTIKGVKKNINLYLQINTLWIGYQRHIIFSEMLSRILVKYNRLENKWSYPDQDNIVWTCYCCNSIRWIRISGEIPIEFINS